MDFDMQTKIETLAAFLLSGSSAGGGYSTTADMIAFAKALNSGVLLRNAYDELSTAGMASPNENNPRFGSLGGAAGVSAVYETQPSAGYSAAILSNVNKGLETPPTAIIIFLMKSDVFCSIPDPPNL